MLDDSRMATPSVIFVDDIHSTDALAEDIRVAVFGLLARVSTKIPYTEPGMAQIKAEVAASLERFVSNGFLAPSVDEDGNLLPAYTITSGAVANASAVDRANRVAPPVQFTARLAGAVHSVEIIGTLIFD